MLGLIQFFVNNTKFTAVLTFMVFMSGLLAINSIKRESYPSVDFAIATVTTIYPGASAAEVEAKVTKPLEDDIRSVSGIKDVRSISQAGRSYIVIRADMNNVNVREVMSDLQQAVNRVSDLPSELPEQPLFTEIKSNEFPVIEMTLIGSNKNRKRDQLAEQFQDELENITGVLNVRLTGNQNREFSVLVDQKEIDKNYASLSQVVNHILTSHQNIPAGTLLDSDKQHLVRVVGDPQNADQLAQSYLRSNFTGKAVQLKDIATVEDGMREADILVRANGEPGTLLIITQKGGADTIKLVNELEEKIAEFKKIMPEGYRIHIHFNEGTKVIQRVSVLSVNALSGLLLVAAFLFLFLPGRSGLMAALSLPLSIFATLTVMQMAELTLNSITILSLVIALGMLVDNAVVITENYTRLRKEGLSVLDACYKAPSQFWLPITATALTTIAAFLPMMVTKGIMGEFIFAIPVVVSVALGFSLIESFFLLPMRLKISARKKIKANDKSLKRDWFDGFNDKFENWMTYNLHHRLLIFIAFGFLILGSIFMMVKVNKFILFPADQTEVYLARFEMPKGTPLEETHKFSKELSENIKETLGNDVRDIITRSGISKLRPDDPKALEGDNVGMALIYVTRAASFHLFYEDALKKLRALSFKKPHTIEFSEIKNGPPVGYAINAILRSNNSEKLNAMTQELMDKMKKLPGIVDLRIDDDRGDPEIFVDVDRFAAARFGLDFVQIGRTLQVALEGLDVKKITLDNKEFFIHVELDQKYKTSIEDLKNLKILNNEQRLIPLSAVASFTKDKGALHIKRYQYQRSQSITGNVKSEIITSEIANTKLFEFFNQLKQKYPEVTLTLAGEAESTRESVESLTQAMILSMIGIFAILVFIFNSYSKPFIIMTTIPLGFIGISIAFLLHQRPISFFALIGIIGLSGIIVNSGIVLISFIEEMRESTDWPLDTILAKASSKRLRAVVVTTLTTVGGLFPTAYGMGGRDEILIPMTLAMAWGLTVGTLFTLVWIPCAYSILEDFKAYLRRLRNKKALA